MSFEIIDNTFQVIVLAAMALLAFLLAFRRSSRTGQAQKGIPGDTFSGLF